MTKVYKFVYGLILTLLNLRKFPTGYLKGKRIVIVGPASSAFNTNNGDFIDSFDVIVRVNKSAGVVSTRKFKNDIGSRTDILFHSFYENEESGGGPLDMDMFTRQGIRFVVNPRNIFHGLRNTFNYYKKYLLNVNTYTLPRRIYRDICKPFGTYRPTIGFTALSFLMTQAEFSELYITGFTFYRTAFGSGYRDQIQAPEKARAFILEQGYHNIDLEFETFKKLLKASEKNIVLDNALKDILEQ